MQNAATLELDRTELTSGWLYHPYSCDDVIGDVYLALGTRRARTSVSDIVSETLSAAQQSSVHITHLISSHLTPSNVTSFQLNWVRCYWSPRWRIGSCASVVATNHSASVRMK